MWMQHQFHQYVRHEVVPAIRMDCRSDDIPIWTTGASHRRVPRGRRRLPLPRRLQPRAADERHVQPDALHRGDRIRRHYYRVSSPLHFVPHLEGRHLEVLRTRHIHIVTGEGKWENIGESLGARQRARRQGDPELRRVVGAGLAARLGHVARDAAEVPGRVDRDGKGTAWPRPRVEQAGRQGARRGGAATLHGRACSPSYARSSGWSSEKHVRARREPHRRRSRRCSSSTAPITRRPARSESSRASRTRTSRPSSASSTSRSTPTLSPSPARGSPTWRRSSTQLYEKVRTAAAPLDLQPVLAGILPTIGKTDLGLENMVPKPRYQMLNRVMNAARGDAFDFSIKGIDELTMRHDSVMVEACNASFQVHLQIAEPERFDHHYNVAQLAPRADARHRHELAIAASAAGCWAETRIALFEQSCDIRTRGLHLREADKRVGFGREWLQRERRRSVQGEPHPLPHARRGRTSTRTRWTLCTGRHPQAARDAPSRGTIYRWNRRMLRHLGERAPPPAHRASRAAVGARRSPTRSRAPRSGSA